jgi:hypothetical protein
MMNRGLGSIMGYRGGGMPVARFQSGGRADQAERDRVILEYTQAVYAQPGITSEAAAAQIAQAMDQFDVSPQEFSGAFQRDTSIVTPEQRDIFGNVGTVQQAYEAVRPEGEYSAAARAAEEANRLAREAAERDAAGNVIPGPGVPTREEVIRNYVDALYKTPGITSEEAALNLSQKMDEVGVSPQEFASAFANTGMFTPEQQEVFGNVDLIQTVYNQYNPTGLYSTLSGDTGTDIGAGTDTGAGTDVGGGGDTGADTGTGTDTGADVGGVGGAGNIDTSTTGREELTGGATFTGAGNVRTDTTIPGVPGFTRQQASGFSFAPIQRGLGQLRGPAYMPGLLQGTEGFGGTGLSQDLVREGIIDYGGRVVPEGTPDAEEINRGVIRDYILNEMIPQGLSPAEVAAASPTLSLGATQQYYNQFAPQGVFSTAAPGRTVLPEDFVLQTGAYTTPVIPRDIAIPVKDDDLLTEQSDADANQLNSNVDGGSGGDNSGGVGGDPNSSGFSFSGFGFGDETGSVGPAGGGPSGDGPGDESGGSVSGTGSPGDESGGSVSGTGSPGDDYEVGGLIRMAEGGEAQESGGDAASNINTYIDRLIASGGTGEDIKGAMNLYGVTPEQVGEAYPQFSLEELTGNYENLQASPAERIRAFEKRYSTEEAVRQAGSKFDVADYLDEQGRLVGGYSKPMYDKFNRFIGYEYKPYESNVVFGEELRGKEAALRPTDEEREQMMVEMAMRQGRTGISPTRGGLAGIEIGDPMMRNRPQYYSTVEQFRPRYAEGGNVSSTAQDLASRGRGGDTMLVHMAPHEVAGLNAIARMQGTELTINPETGMPEALKLGKLFKTLAPFIPFIPGVGQFLAPAFGALGMGGFSPLLQKAITSGIVGGFTGPKGGFDLQRGLMQGITAYGLGSLQQNLAGPSTPGGPPTSTGPAVASEFGAVDPSVTGQNPLLAPGVGDNASLSALERAELGIRPPIDYTPGDITAASKAAEATRAGFPLSDVERGGVSDLGAPFEYQPVSPENAATTASGMKTPTALLTTGLGLSSTADYDKLTSAGIAVKREKEEEG